MYLTAQRVRTPERDREGVNIYIYTHFLAPARAIEWNAPDVATIAEHMPGRLALTITAVAPGQNVVLSYLDVAVADATPAREIAKKLEQAMDQFPDGKVPVVWQSSGLGLRFAAVPRFHQDVAGELRRLKDELILVLAADRGAVPAPQPLQVLVESDDVGDRYRLNTESRQRLRALLPELTIPESLGVTHNARHLFEESTGEPFIGYAQALTHLTIERINALAGIVFVDAKTGHRLWDSRHSTSTT